MHNIDGLNNDFFSFYTDFYSSISQCNKLLLKYRFCVQTCLKRMARIEKGCNYWNIDIYECLFRHHHMTGQVLMKFRPKHQMSRFLSTIFFYSSTIMFYLGKNGLHFLSQKNIFFLISDNCCSLQD